MTTHQRKALAWLRDRLSEDITMEYDGNYRQRCGHPLCITVRRETSVIDVTIGRLGGVSFFNEHGTRYRGKKAVKKVRQRLKAE